MARGRARPTLYPRTIRASIRLSEDEVRMIEECIEKLGTNRSDIISKGIKEIYKKNNSIIILITVRFNWLWFFYK